MKQPKRKFLIFALIVLICSGWHASAFAYIDPPVLVPPDADVDQPVGVRLGWGDCDAFVEAPDGAYPQITVTGNQIHLVMFSVHYDNPIECIFFPEIFTQPLGAFGAGRYTVIVDRVYPDVGGLATERLAQLPLVVGGAGTPAAQLSVNAPFALLATILALMMIAWITFRRSGTNTLILTILVPVLFFPPKTAFSQEESPYKFVELLVRSSAGAPSPEEITAISLPTVLRAGTLTSQELTFTCLQRSTNPAPTFQT